MQVLQQHSLEYEALVLTRPSCALLAKDSDACSLTVDLVSITEEAGAPLSRKRAQATTPLTTTGDDKCELVHFCWQT